MTAAALEPWRAVARRCGLQERRFTAYDVAGSKTV